MVEEEEGRGGPTVEGERARHDPEVGQDVVGPHVREQVERRDHVEPGVAQLEVGHRHLAVGVVPLVRDIHVTEPESVPAEAPRAPAHLRLEHVDPQIGAHEPAAAERMRQPPIATSDLEHTGVRTEPGVLGEQVNELIAECEEALVGLARGADSCRGQRRAFVGPAAARRREPQVPARAQSRAPWHT